MSANRETCGWSRRGFRRGRNAPHDTAAKTRLAGPTSDPITIQKAVTARLLLGAAGGNLMALAVATMASMANVKIYLSFVDRADYGVVVLVGTLADWAALGSLGLGTAVPQRMTVLLARNKVAEAAKVLTSGMSFYAAMAAVMLAGLTGLHFLGATSLLIKNDGTDVARAAALLYTGAALFLFTFPLAPINGVLLALNDFFAINAFNIGLSIFRPVLTYVILSATGSIATMFVASTVYSIAGYLAVYAYVLHKAPALRVRPSLASRSVISALMVPSLLYFVISIGFTVVYSTDNAVISTMIGISAIPAYAVAFRLFNTLRGVCLSGGEALFPATGILHERGEDKRLQTCIEVNARISLTLAVLGGAALAVFGEPIIGVWLGPEISPGRGTLLVFGALLPVAVLVNIVCRSVNAVGRPGTQAAIYSVEMALNLGISVALAPVLGVFGVALGTLLSRVLVVGGYVADAVHKLGISAKRLIAVAVLPNAALAGGLLAAGWWVPVPAVMPLTTLLTYLGCYSAVCVLASAALLPAQARQAALRWLAGRRAGGKLVDARVGAKEEA